MSVANRWVGLYHLQKSTGQNGTTNGTAMFNNERTTININLLSNKVNIVTEHPLAAENGHTWPMKCSVAKDMVLIASGTDKNHCPQSMWAICTFPHSGHLLDF